MIWISVKDKLPDLNRLCITAVVYKDKTRGVELDFLNYDYDWEYNSFLKTGRDITHWMYAPKLPNNKK